MKKTLLAIMVLLSMQARAQNVGIGTTTPDATAKLDISSTNSGILIPRLSTTARNNISNPARGLMLYDSTVKAFYYFDGTAWKALSVPGELVKLTESGKTGYRLRDRDSIYYGPIGNDAVDFSMSADSLTPNGATGNHSAAFGMGTIASGEGAVALGYSTRAYNIYSMATGSFTFATGANSLSAGAGSNAAGNNSLAAGQFTRAPSVGEAAFGNYNTYYTPAAGGESAIKKSDRAFVVGIGTNDTARKDGLIVYKDGTLALQRLSAAPDSVTGRLYAINNKLFYNGSVLSDSSQLQRIAERGKTGFRLLGRDSVFYGSIGEQAVDLSFSNSLSDTFGATGNYAAAIGTRVTASGENAVAIGFESLADGAGTIALGTRDTASGFNALAMGFSTKASGVNAASLGDHTIASGSTSLASGLRSKATGDISTAMGDHTIAKSYAEVALGTYNTDYTVSAGGVTGIFPQDRALVVGSGTHDTARNDALIVYKDGTVELDVHNIQPAVTAKRLYVLNDKLFYNGGFLGDSSQLQKITENGKTGYRLLGRDSANFGNIGIGAVDFSNSLMPSLNNGATGDRSVAIGTGVIASGTQSVAVGNNTLASGLDAIALGSTDSATGNYAVAMGLNTIASGYGAMSTGFNTRAVGVNSLTTGANAQALGNFSVAAGTFTTARSLGEAVFGSFNTDYQVSPTGAININGVDRALVIGIGTHDTARKDGLVVYKDGTITFYKQNVMPVGSQNKLFAFGNELYYGNKLLSGYLRQVTRNGKTGFRIVTYDDLTQDSMGQHAVDLSVMANPVFRNKRIGDYSFAAGYFGTPSGETSISIGNSTLAKGNNSAAIGLKTIARSFGEMAVGSFNTDYTTADSINFKTADRAFVVGIGTSDLSRKDGLIVYKDGSLALDVRTTLPAITVNRLYAVNNKLFYNGAALSDSSQLQRITENGKTGYRLLGRDTANTGNTGEEALDLSYQSLASSVRGSTGDYSFAAGFNTSAPGLNATAVGNETTASGYASLATGVKSTASGDVSTALGFETLAGGGRSFAVGTGTIARSYSEMAAGVYNTDYSPASEFSYNSGDRAFAVGIGTSAGNRNDGLIIYKDGTAELDVLNTAPAVVANRIYNIGNTLYINGTVVGSQTSDARYKERVENMPSVLAGINKLRPVRFYWKENKWGAQKEIGFLAQELKNQFPEVVSTDADGYYKVNYGLLTAVLTKGLQEQQEEITRLQKRSDTLEKTIEELMKRLAMLEEASAIKKNP